MSVLEPRAKPLEEEVQDTKVPGIAGFLLHAASGVALLVSIYLFMTLVAYGSFLTMLITGMVAQVLNLTGSVSALPSASMLPGGACPVFSGRRSSFACSGFQMPSSIARRFR